MLLSRVCVAILTSVACVGAVDTSAAQENPTIDLGELDSLDVFFSMLGTNSSQWVDISEYETPDDPAVIDTWRNTPPNTTVFDLDTELSLVSRQQRYNYCQDLTGFARIVCENMPHRYAVWVAGGAYIISYGPGALTEWLNGMAAAIRAGRNVRAAWIGDDNGGGGGQPVPDSRRAIAGASLPDDTNIRFAIPADLHGMQKRQVSEEGTIGVKITSDYIYNSATKELTYESSSGSFSFGASESLMARTPAEKRQSKDYTIVLRSVRVTPALTVAPVGCISRLLRTHLDRSSETNRFGCYPIDNNGSWKAKLHVNINKGRFNYGTYGTCC